MKHRPILFSGTMVRAILDGRKTQTRRVVTKHTSVCGSLPWDMVQLLEAVSVGHRLNVPGPMDTLHRVRPRIEVGDRLWARETHCFTACPACEIPAPFGGGQACICQTPAMVRYRATDEYGNMQGGWRPSIHMPRWASRLTLDVTSVRVERLQAITEADAKAEGVEPSMTTESWAVVEKHTLHRYDILGPPTSEMEADENLLIKHQPAEQMASARHNFRYLWDEINAKRAPWDENPWVWVIEFKVAAIAAHTGESVSG